MSKLIFGCGYLGSRVARRWREAGEDVFVVTRSAEHARGFTEAGYRPIVADVLRPPTLANLPTADTVLYAVGFDRSAGVSMFDVFVEGLRAALDALSSETRKLIYVSSTGVYGQEGDEWVDEDSPCEPQREGGRACLAAERVLQNHALGSHAITLRMAGLYCPNRIPHATEIVRGQPIATPEHGYLNLIHVDDAVSVVLAAEARSAAPRTYVVSDGHPVDRGEYFAELARVLHAPPPTFAPPMPDAPAAVRAASSKRVKNSRMLAELNISLNYPSYREGLAAIVNAEAQSPSAS